MTEPAFPESIVCAYLYIITKYGYPPPASETRQHLKEMVDLGFSSVELEGIREHHLTEMFIQRNKIAESLDEFKVQVPVFCTVLPELSNDDSKSRTSQLALFEKGCQIAATIGAKLILDNGPLPPYQMPTGVPLARHYEQDLLSSATIRKDFDWDIFWQQLIRTLQEICDRAAHYNLEYLIHPAFGVLGATPEAFLYLAHAVDRKNFGFNFDTSNLIALKCNLSLALHQLRPYIKYLHLSDNRGLKNEHIPLGQGTINWDLFFKTLKDIEFSGPIGIDIGGSESKVEDLDQAYIDAVSFVVQYFDNQQPAL